MLAELTVGFIFWIVIFLFLIVIGHDLFAIMVDEQIHYLLLIAFYAPISPAARIPCHPEPVARYVSWALGEHRNPVGCVRIRHNGRIRYGKTGRWMNMTGEAFFSLATPGFVWHASITYAPGIWLEAFDYYVHHQAGMNLNLFSFLPLNNSHDEEIKTSSLFRYLAGAPLFPGLFAYSNAISLETIDDSAAKAIIHDQGRRVEAIVRFDGWGRITGIEACRKIQPETGRPLPGYFASRFSSYSEAGGYMVPVQMASDLILPDGTYACAEYTITDIEFDPPDTLKRRGLH